MARKKSFKTNGVTMETMMAAMFYRKVQPSEIESMTYHRMKSYYEYHELVEKEIKKNNTIPKDKK